MTVESYRPQVGTVLEQLAEGLAPFVDKHMSAYFDGADWIVTAATRMGKREPALATAADPQFQLEVMVRWWGPVFSKLLAVDDRDAITELRSIRNQWAHIVDDQPLDLARAIDALPARRGPPPRHRVAGGQHRGRDQPDASARLRQGGRRGSKARPSPTCS